MHLLSSHLFSKKLRMGIMFFSFKRIQKIVFFITNNLNKYINFVLIKNNQINIYLNKENILNVSFFLKNSSFLLCNQLLDITIIDRLEFLKNGYRWEFIYVFLSTYYNIRILIRGYLKFYDFLPTLTKIFNSANWLEREVWDMFGIYIKNHPDLRRILTDYAFIGSPLRKDFPLNGYLDVRYDEDLKIIVVEPLELSQELREFRLENPWK
jgi:NADH:ubiquinone oxidoreductase subunit C